MFGAGSIFHILRRAKRRFLLYVGHRTVSFSTLHTGTIDFLYSIHKSHSLLIHYCFFGNSFDNTVSFYPPHFDFKKKRVIEKPFEIQIQSFDKVLDHFITIFSKRSLFLICTLLETRNRQCWHHNASGLF